MAQKKGWLVVNGFVQSPKFLELYRLFHNSAKQLNTSLETVPTHKLMVLAEDGFKQFCRPDFVLFWDKDTNLAKRMEAAGFVLFNSARAVEICDSKTLTVMELCGKAPLPQTLFSPKTFPGVGYGSLEFVRHAAEKLGLPLVIKEAYGSFGEQVYLAKTLQEAEEIVLGLQDKEFVMQQFVSNSCGRDVRMNVVGNRIVSAMLRQSQSDFRSNATLGGKVSAYTPDREQVEVALAAVKAIGLDFAGVDILFGEKGPLVCEVNSNPHFKTALEATGVDMSLEILKYILTKI